MHVLLIKMSSMGDVIHTLPALTDATHAIPNLKIDWVVEPAFADIPTWHPTVDRIIPMPLRRWRKNIVKAICSGEIKRFYQTLKQKKYDLVIDAQGLLKSAVVSKLVKAQTHGLDKKSSREPLSSYFYDCKYAVDKNQHAVTRTRALFSKSLGYVLQNTSPNYQIDTEKLPLLNFETPKNYFVFLHGTTWTTKHYPETYWQALMKKSDENKMTVYLPWGNKKEKHRAEKLAKPFQYVHVLPKLKISEIATLLKNASAIVAVDTGLGHLSAALSTPTISLYGPTDPKRIGTLGDNQLHLTADFSCAPCVSKTCSYKKAIDINPACYTTLAPKIIWQKLKNMSVSE